MLTDPAKFDHWDPQLADDPHPTYEQLRESCPVARSDAHDGFWVLSRYADVKEAAGRPGVFTSTMISIPEDIGLAGVPLPPLNIDPPQHTKVRRMLLPFFSPARADAMRPVTTAIANDLVDGFVDRGECDAASEYARPLPSGVLARILGVSPDDEPTFAGWIHAIVEGGANQNEQATQAGMELLQYFTQLFEERRRKPADDLVSFLLEERVDGEPMSEADRLGCCILLLIAGIDTTWSVLGSSLLYLAEHPEHRDVFREDTPRAGRAVEELLRAFAPTSVARGVTTDTELHGSTLRAGDKALLLFPSANRDPRQFECPDEVRFDRENNRHLAFGYGVHVCLGAPLGRMEVAVGLREFLRRVPEFKLRDDGLVRWKPGPIRGPNHVPLTFVTH